MNTIRIINNKYGDLAKQFETLSWCLKAIAGKNETRENLKHLYIDPDFMACTDGHRMHIALNDWDYEPGLYEIVTVKANEIILAKSETFSLKDYPDVWRAVPSQCKNGIPPFECCLDRKSDLVNRSCLVYHVYSNTQRCYNLQHLEDARMEGYMKFETGGDSSLLLLASEDHDRLAMIMPYQH